MNRRERKYFLTPMAEQDHGQIKENVWGESGQHGSKKDKVEGQITA